MEDVAPAQPTGPEPPPETRVAVQAVGPGNSMHLAIALKGQEAHRSWTAMQVAPQRVSELERLVYTLEGYLANTRHELATSHLRVRSQEEHFHAVTAYATRMGQEAAHQQQMTWHEAEMFAETVLVRRDEVLRQEVQGEVAEYVRLLRMHEEHQTKLKLTNDSQAAELQAFRQQFAVVRSTLEHQGAHDLRVELAAMQVELQNKESYNAHLREEAYQAQVRSETMDPRVGQLQDEVDIWRRRHRASETCCDVQAKRLGSLQYQLNESTQG